MQSRVRWTDPALAGLSGVLLVLSFPRFDLGAIAWVALAPLLVAMDGKRPAWAGFLGFLSGLVFFPGLFYWVLAVEDYNALDHLFLAVYLSGYFAVFGAAVAWIRKRSGALLVVAAPPVWVALEYLRGHASFLTLPWLLLGYSQYLHAPLIQVTALTGVYGLAFLLLTTNGFTADLVREWTRVRTARTPGPVWSRTLRVTGVVVTLLLLSTYLYGRVVLWQPLPELRIRTAVVQGNVPQQGIGRDAVLDRYTSLTRKASEAGAVLTVWPETAVPGDVKHDPRLRRSIEQLAVEARTALLVGSSESAKFANGHVPTDVPKEALEARLARDPTLQVPLHNSLFLLSPRGTLEDEYRKMVLVPFGEYEPLKGVIRWPKAIAASFGRMVPGDRYTLFSVNGVEFGAVICWEVIFPDLFREFVRRGATFMVNATNESWFGPTATPYQLLAMATIRAAENRVAIARAANTGLSAFIDPYGRITDRVRDASGRELFVEGVLAHDVPVSRTRTFYTRYGDVFAFLQIALSAALLVYAWRPRALSIVRRRELPA